MTTRISQCPGLTWHPWHPWHPWDRHEYTSKWANLPPLTNLFPLIEGGVPVSEQAAVTNVIRGRGRFAFDATSDSPTTAVVLPIFYFPGWVVEIDGIETPAEPDDLGLITFTLPPGRHHVTARFADTLPRTLGWIVAAATLLGVTVWWGWRRGRLFK